jgi:bacteriorhodopsin
MLLIITIGWSIYPIGYFLGYFFDAANLGTLNLIYNVADFVNKIAFGLVIWAAAIADSQEQTEASRSGSAAPAKA